MQQTSALYRSILRGEHDKEVKAVIAGETYTEGDGVLSLSSYGGLFSRVGIGNCSARQIDMLLLPRAPIPRQAKIQLYVRLVAGDLVSEWLPKGEFFLSTRDIDEVTGVMTIHGFDAMLKAEAVWLDESYAEENFPMAPDAAVQDICRRMEVELDSRTVLDPKFPVHYPVDGEGDMTMREVLSRLAVANAGNWTVTDAGKLYLLPLNSIPPDSNYLVTEDGSAIVFGGVRILI